MYWLLNTHDMYDMQNSFVAAGDSDKSLFHSIVAL